MEKMVKHLFTMVFYIVLLATVFSSVLFGDKSLYPMTYAGRSTEYLLSNEAVAHNIDSGGIYADSGAADWVEIPLMMTAAQSVRNGELPLWNPYNSLGMPVVDNNNGSTLAPFSLIIYVGNSEVAWNFMYLARLLFIMFFTYLFLQELGVQYFPSIVGGILFGFSGYVMLYLNIFFLHVDAFLPVLMWLTVKYIKNRKFCWWIGCTLAITAMCLGGNPQNLITCCMLSFCFFLVFAFDKFAIKKANIYKTVKETAIYLACYISAILLSLGYWMSFFTLYTSGYSYHANAGLQTKNWESLLGLLIPRGRFNAYYRGLWLPYVGILGIGIIALQLRWRKKAMYYREKLFFSLFSILFLAKILGFPLLQWIGRLPVLNELSFTKYNSCVYFSVAILAALALNDMILDANRKRDAVVGIFLMILAVIVNVSYYVNLFEAGHQLAVFLKYTSIACLLFVVIYVLAYIFQKPRIMYGTIMISLCMELLGYTASCSDLYIPKDVAFKAPECVEQLKNMQENEYDRVFSVGTILMGNLSALYHIPSIGGISATPEIHYWNFMNELILEHNTDLQMVTAQSTAYYPTSKRFLDMLGIRYFILDNYGEIADEHLTLSYNSGPLKIYENTAAFPRAYIVHNVISVADEAEALAVMKDNELNFLKYAVVEQGNSGDVKQIGNDSTDIVEIMDYNANSVSIKCHMESDGLLVLNDLYYPGWTVYVNGKKKDIVRTNDILRGVYLEQGDMVVEYIYRPMAFYVGTTISVFYMLILLGIGIYKKYKGERK